MLWWQWALSIWAVPMCLFWFLMAFLLLRIIWSLPRLSTLELEEPVSWPLVSVIIPACNEEASLEDAIQSLLAQDYPALEVWLVDDRSTDKTGEVIDALAARDPRIRPLRVESLPAGWLGKVHAMHVATQHAQGEWLLFTDADVHFRADTLRRAVSFLRMQKTDFLSVIPSFRTPGFLLNILTESFGMGFSLSLRIWKIGSRKSRAFAGMGAFNMIRRETFARTPGFPWLKMEVLDDVGLALMAYHAGARASLAGGYALLEVAWYESLPAMMRGVEKNMFGSMGFYHYGFFAFKMLLFVLAFVGPFVALLPLGVPGLMTLGWGAVAALCLSSAFFSRWKGDPFWAGLFAPLGTLFLTYPAARSAWRCWKQGGIIWRDTLYPIEALRAGMRLHLLSPEQFAPSEDALEDPSKA